MEKETFNALAHELGQRFRGTGERWIVITWKPGGDDNPHSAGNLDVDQQVAMLRSIADSLESRAAEEIIRTKL